MHALIQCALYPKLFQPAITVSPYLKCPLCMRLVQVVYEAALQLYNTHLTNSHLMQYQAADSDKPGPLPPYIWLASALVIAIKLLYGLGGSVGQMPTVAKAASPPGGWQVWAQHVIEKLPGMSSLPLTEQEVSSS